MFWAAAIFCLWCNASSGQLADSSLPVRLPAEESEPLHINSDSDIFIIEPGPSWYAPEYWFGTLWKGSIQVGINGTDGNAQTFSMRAGGDLTHETETHKLLLNLAHARTTANSISTQNNALGKARYDWLFGESPWTLFTKGNIEYDQFKAFDIRVVGNAGVGYRFIETDVSKLSGRFGAGVSHEIGGPDDSYVPEAVFALEYERQLTEKQKLTAEVEYFPDFGSFSDFRIVTDIGWRVVIDEEANLSLKVGVIDRYDSTPQGLKPNDFDYSVLLLWEL